MNTGDVQDALLRVGVPVHLKGFEYLTYAIEAVCADNSLLRAITTELYPSVAEAFNVTPQKAERAIRTAIEVSFGNIPFDLMDAVFGNSLDACKSRPTNRQFIASMVLAIRRKII